MTSLYNSQIMLSIGVVLIAYSIIVPIVGVFKAFVAVRLGDATPAQQGYLTLHPLAHMSIFWVVMLVISQLMYGYMPFGLGNQIILQESNFRYPYQKLRFLAALFSDTLMAFFIALSSFMLLVMQYSTDLVKMLYNQQPVLKNFTQAFVGHSSFAMVIGWIFSTMFLMASFTTALTFLFNIFYILQARYLDKIVDGANKMYFLWFILPIVGLFLLTEPLCTFVIKIVMMSAGMLLYALGLLS